MEIIPHTSIHTCKEIFLKQQIHNNHFPDSPHQFQIIKKKPEIANITKARGQQPIAQHDFDQQFPYYRVLLPNEINEQTRFKYYEYIEKRKNVLRRRT